MTKNKGGRPTKMSKETITKLEEVFALGGSDSEACFYANISKQTLYNYQKEHPEFVDRKEALKEKPILKARQTVVKALDDPKDAQWFLERKRKEEFSLRQELTGAEGESLDPIKIEIVTNEYKGNNSVPEKLEQQKENSGESGVNKEF
jgi:hypothetical protein